MNFLYYSNQSERLTQKLAELLSQQALSPFQKELVLIQTPSMEQHLSLSLAEHNGICSGISFSFPARFLKELLSLKLSAPFPFDSKRTGWLIWRMLSSPKLDKSCLPPFVQKIFEQEILDPSLQGKQRKQEEQEEKRKNSSKRSKGSPSFDSLGGLRQYHFACHLAHLFDRYLLYDVSWTFGGERRDRLRNFKKGKEPLEDWQAYIWEMLCQEYPELDLKSHLSNFFSLSLKKEKIERLRVFLPPRIFVFCIPFLAPLIEKILMKMNDSLPFDLDIHWFFLESGPKSLETKKDSSHGFWRHYDKFRDSLSIRLASQIQDAREESQGSLFNLCKEVQGPSLLKDIQRSLYHDSSSKGKKLSPLPLDSSFSIQNCHSPLREVEVLRDWILEQFQKNPKLQPEDILILSLSPELYAPFIESVFSGEGEEKNSPSLPYNIRSPGKEDMLSFSNIFFKLMDLGEMRFEAAEVFSIISDPLFSKNFGLSPEDLEIIREYIVASSICWALDGKDRARYGLEAEDKHTFKEGLSRLFLSYALAPNASAPFLESLSSAQILDIEGQNAERIGDLAEILERLAFYAEKLRGSYRLSQWAQILSEMEEALLGTGKTEELLESLREIEREGSFSKALGLAPIRIYLEKCQSELTERHGFSSHAPGIQFADLSSMRGLAYPVICLLGMNEKEFPRRERNYEFDLLEVHGNAPPSQSRQDRLLFLELLLCARSQLYISYVGQSQHRPSESFAPSLILSELGSYVDSLYASEEGLSPFARLVQKHSIHAFSEIYFSPAKRRDKEREFFSYAIENCRAAEALRRAELEGTKEKAFLDAFSAQDSDGSQERERLEARKEEEDQRIELQSLLDFFRDPARTWVQENLEFSLPSSFRNRMPPKEEPLVLDRLEEYKICMDLTKAMIQNEAKKESLLREGFEERLRDFLPHGNYGELLKEKLWEESLSFLESVQECSQSQSLKSLERDFSLKLRAEEDRPRFVLSGRLELFSNEEGALVLFDYAKCKGVKYLEFWILSLLFYLSWQEESMPKQKRKAYLVCKDQYVEYELDFLDLSLLVESALKIDSKQGKKEKTTQEAFSPLSYLSRLCSLYLRSLQEPLCYFSETSWAYASRMSEEKKTKKSPQILRKALSDAQKKWYGGAYSIGECEGPYAQLCFRERDPFQELGSLYREFQKLSLELWEPVLKYSKVHKIS